jgi:trk system potassium uptake protein TrkH
MKLGTVQRIVGILLVLFSISLLPPVVVSLLYADGNTGPFLDTFAGSLLLGALLWWPARRRERELRIRDGFLLIALFWVLLSLLGAVPFLLSDMAQMSFTDAVFESAAGFTTTSASVLIGLDAMAPSILYYRQQTQWLGGIGMVVVAIALLPMLGVGGMQVLRPETPGQIKGAKLVPRITETAKALGTVYLAITAVCAGVYWMAGMSPFDAIAHSFSTVSTGGFSTHDESLAFFQSPVIEFFACLFMVLGSINFALHFLAWRHMRLRDYVRDPECRAFLLLLGGGLALCTATLWFTSTVADPMQALRVAFVQTVSMQTSTGFTTASFAAWPAALPAILILMTFVGGCAGSTSGGIKVLRMLLLWKQGSREVVRLVHPSAELPVKLGQKAVEARVIDAVWGFFAVYVVSFGVLMLSFMATGADQVTAFSAIATCVNNTGPGLGMVAETYDQISTAGKWICIIAMLLGRLEVLPLLVLLTPTFWRR